MCLGEQERRRREASPTQEHSLTPPASLLLRVPLTDVQGGVVLDVDHIGAEGEDEILPGLANDSWECKTKCLPCSQVWRKSL